MPPDSAVTEFLPLHLTLLMKIGFEGHQESVELDCLYVWKEQQSSFIYTKILGLQWASKLANVPKECYILLWMISFKLIEMLNMY